MQCYQQPLKPGCCQPCDTASRALEGPHISRKPWHGCSLVFSCHIFMSYLTKMMCSYTSQYAIVPVTLLLWSHSSVTLIFPLTPCLFIHCPVVLPSSDLRLWERGICAHLCMRLVALYRRWEKNCNGKVWFFPPLVTGNQENLFACFHVKGSL